MADNSICLMIGCENCRNKKGTDGVKERREEGEQKTKEEKDDGQA